MRIYYRVRKNIFIDTAQWGSLRIHTNFLKNLINSKKDMEYQYSKIKHPILNFVQ